MTPSENLRHPGSFRDPSGFVFREKGVYYRQVQLSYADDYQRMMRSGLYEELTRRKLLIAHQEIDENLTGVENWYKTLYPEQLELITYPYEWCFDELRDAAIHTLTILVIAIEKEMILKDASPFNIQFRDGKPVFIDTLSFEKYDPSSPWVAYRQFCECFLFPLYLEHYTGIGLQKMLTAYPDGIPAPVTAGLLSFRGRLNMGVWMHVHLQNIVRGDGRNNTSGDRRNPGPGNFSKQKLLHLVRHLQTILPSLRPKPAGDSTWSNYYGTTILSRDYLEKKEAIFRQLIAGITFRSALDLGANDGHFSQILAGCNPNADSTDRPTTAVIAVDADTQCINTLYRHIREKDIRNIQPLCVDIANPTAAIGFRNRERSSFSDRVKAELVVALALIHHLVFGRSIPLVGIAGCLAELTANYLLIEFVPLEDEKVQALIKNKKSFHLPYDEPFFEAQMTLHFVIEKKEPVPGTKRVLYLMKKMLV